VDMFEPGSTMKPLTISAALESGKYVPSSIIDTSPGSLVIGNHRIRDHGNNGPIDLKTIIVKSSNVGVAKIALSLPRDTLPLFYKRMGFGARSPLKFPGESGGLILPPNLWNVAEVATMSYGYAINATVIQLAQAYATLASGGIQHPVTLFKQDTPPTGVRVLDEQIARDVISMMEGVTAQGGTAKQAAIAGYRVAGKTGTAHKIRPDGKGYSNSDYRGLFVGMAPASDPQIVLAVVVENPIGQYYGGLVAAPIFAKIMQESLRLRNVPLDKSLEPEPKVKK
jgi:cell division protein FtsI (penicillin-binding protein 3)